MADSNRLGEKCQAKCTFFDAYFLLFLIINWKCNLNTLKFFETENMRIIFINVFFFLFILHTHEKKMVYFQVLQAELSAMQFYFHGKSATCSHIFSFCNQIFLLYLKYTFNDKIAVALLLLLFVDIFVFFYFFSYILTIPLYYVRMQFWLCCVVTALTASSKIHGTN